MTRTWQIIFAREIFALCKYIVRQQEDMCRPKVCRSRFFSENLCNQRGEPLKRFLCNDDVQNMRNGVNKKNFHIFFSRSRRKCDLWSLDSASLPPRTDSSKLVKRTETSKRVDPKSISKTAQTLTHF